MNMVAKQSGWPTFTQDDIDGILYKNVMKFLNLK